MDKLQLTQVPITKTGMLIRKPVAEVFEASWGLLNSLWSGINLTEVIIRVRAERC